MNTHRAYLGSDTTITVWLRDEAGKVTFTDGDEITLTLYPYGSTTDLGADIDGTFADETPGRVAFTITAEYADANLTRGPFRYVVRIDGVQAQDGLLEVV